MSTLFQAKRELARKKAQLAYLKHYVSETLPLVTYHFEAGFFVLCADQFQAYAKHCQNIVELQAEVARLTLELERVEAASLNRN